jgi:Tfp pilus assembly protein PilX
MSTTTHSQRGSIILYAMLTMSVMLAIGLTLSGLFISKLRGAAAARDSMVALYAADSAVEICLYEARTGTTDPEPRLVFPSGVLIQITDITPTQTDITSDCSVLSAAPSASFGFRATGTYRGVSRTLEISQ